MALRDSGGSCSPRGWASCLLVRLEEFQSGALSAGAGLYLRHPGQGAYNSNASETLSMAKHLDVCVCMLYASLGRRDPFAPFFEQEWDVCNVLKQTIGHSEKEHTKGDCECDV